MITKGKRKLSVILLISFIFWGLMPLSTIFADDADREEIISKWLDRVELSIQVETNKKPTYYFQTVQPLYLSDDELGTIFVQPRISLRDERATYNLGFGYRRLVSENLLLGANMFGDYQALHRHGRIGFGMEAFGQILEARFNSYFGGITSKRIVVDDQDSGVQTVERVVDGVDLEVGAPVPYVPWLKLYTSGFFYDHKDTKDRSGFKNRAEVRLNEALRLEFFTWDDNKGDRVYGGRLRFNLAFDTLWDLKDAFKLADEPFPERDLKEMLLIPVERNFDIEVEKFDRSSGLVVEAGRS